MPHLRIVAKIAYNRPYSLLVAFVLQCEDVLIAVHKSKSILSLSKLLATIGSFLPLLLVHIELHKHCVRQTTCKTAIVAVAFVVTCRQYHSCLQVVLNKLNHLLLRKAWCRIVVKRIFEQLLRSYLYRSIEVVQDIRKPSTSTMEFCHKASLLCLIHIYSRYTIHCQSHLADKVDVVLVCSNSTIRV